MAKRFLTHLDMVGNQIINAAFEKLATDPTTGNFEGRIYYNTATDLIKIYDGAAWKSAGAITAINGTTDEVTVSTTDGVVTISLPSTINADTTGNSATATKLATSRTIELTGDVTGSASFDGSANASITATIAANSVALGTDTTGNYVADLTAGSGISVSGGGSETANITVTNSDKGSSQNIFKNVAVVGQSDIVADTNDDTLTVASGTGISITTNATTDTLTIGNSGVTSVAGTTNQITASASTGSVTLSLPNAVTFPGTVTLNADPSSDLQAATKQYVDSVAQGLDVKASVKVATTSNGTFTTAFADGSTVDGVALITGDRILIKNQTDATKNGIYTVNATGAPTRSTDMNADSEFPGAFTFVEQGTANADTGWVCISNSVTVGSSNVNFSQFSGAGAYTAGNGLSLSGGSFSIDTSITVDKNTAQTLTNKTLTSPTITGAVFDDGSIVFEGTTADAYETTLTVTDPTADRTITLPNATGTVALTSDLTGLTHKVSASVGNTSATSFAISHNLGTRDVQVQVFDNATYDTVECDVVRTDTNTVTVSFTTAPTTNAYRVVVVG
jgi:hypothetical protein